ncbi:MAG TPA: ABC transporter ATP-binding protein [Thermoplasmata archaeon]|nr:ABC transporter ATP-binding protein [Thermoplasmata archaeon]
MSATNGATAAESEPLPQRSRPARSHRDFGFARAGGARRRVDANAPPPIVRTRQATASKPGHDVVLDIENLKTYFFTYDGVVRAIDGINLQARARETTGVVGETGCGKSVTAFSVARLISEPGMVISGKVRLNGANLLWGLEKEAKFRRLGKDRVKVIKRFRRIRAANERMSAVRGKGVGMIFQEPQQAMNPVFSIADQLGEAVMLHQGVEVLDGMLRAATGVSGGPTSGPGSIIAPDAAGATTGATLVGMGPEVEMLIKTAAEGTQDELRAAAVKLAQTAGLRSLAPELFYLLRDAGPQAPNRRRRVQRALDRTHLSGFQERYIRHLRRVAVLDRAMKDVYLKEMRLEKTQSGARRKIALRLFAEKWSHFYFGIRGIRGRAERPVKAELFWRVVELLEGVRIANPVQVARGFPHELSGGMLQRAMIAMALSSEPGLLLADEPTTALDVTIQAQILELMRDLRERVGTAIVLITHDLGVVAEVCDVVNVMYAGIIVETGPVHELYRRPLHPYTQGLLASIPRFDQPGKELSSIPGSVPNLIHPPTGCRFHPRCPYAMPICREVRPEPQIQGPDHMVACHLYTEPLEPSLAGPTPVPAPA